jgi:hypothetical protein
MPPKESASFMLLDIVFVQISAKEVVAAAIKKAYGIDIGFAVEVFSNMNYKLVSKTR